MINHPNRRKGYKRKRIAIPDDLHFADLKITREPDGSVAFDTAVIARICEASGIDPATLLESHEDNVAGLIIAWYLEHKRRGGAPDATVEDLISEAETEGNRGSHEPGKA